MQVIEFECRGQRFGLPLACVRHVVPSALPAPLPGACPVVLGVLNIGGDTVAVLDLARRAGGVATELAPSHQFLVAELGGFPCALVVDNVTGVGERELAAQWHRQAGGAPFVDAAIVLEDGMCLLLDPQRFLFDDEKAALAAALAGGTA